MAIERKLTDVVEASNRLTDIVDRKIITIDKRMLEAEEQFKVWRQKKDIHGDISKKGVFNSNIFQGFIENTVGSSDSKWPAWAEGGFLPTPLGTMDNVFVHFKTPLNLNLHNEMFWFHIQGYSYGSALIANEILAGYCYKEGRELLSKSASGNLLPNIYADKNGNIVLRIKVPNIYYTTLKVDTMKVGNGRLFEMGDLTAKLSLKETELF